METSPYFDWSNAWVFCALGDAHDDSGRVVFSALVGAGDFLNHAIFNDAEIHQGLSRLHQRGIVDVHDGSVTVTPLAKSLHSKIRSMRGDLFSMVDNALKALNSPRANLPFVQDLPDLRFITREFLAETYQIHTQPPHTPPPAKAGRRKK